MEWQFGREMRTTERLVPRARREAHPTAEAQTHRGSSLTAATMRVGRTGLATVLLIAAVADAKDSFNHRSCTHVGETDMEASGGANVSSATSVSSALSTPCLVVTKGGTIALAP